MHSGESISMKDSQFIPATAKDIEAILAKAGPTQTIRIEQAPLKITTDTDNKETFKM